MQYLLAKELDYLKEGKCEQISEEAVEIARMLSGLRTYLLDGGIDADQEHGAKVVLQHE